MNMIAHAVERAASLDLRFVVAWTLLIAAGIGLELFALSRPAKGDTLSELVWFIREIPGWGSFLIFMLCAFLLWLLLHFATRWV